MTASAVAVGRGDVSATLSGGGDSTPFNNTDSAFMSVGYQQNWAARLTGVPVGATLVGSPAEFAVNVAKAGAADLAGPLTLSGSVPGSLTANAIGGPGWACQPGPQFSCTPTTLSWGALTVNITPTPLAFPAAAVSVQISAPGDQNPADDAEVGEIKVARAHDTKLNISASKKSLKQGATATVRVSVDNLRTAAKTPAAVSVTLPQGFSLLSAGAQSGRNTGVTCMPGQPFTCTFARGTGLATATVRVARDAPTGTAEVRAALTDDRDEDTSNNTASVTWQVKCCPPALRPRRLNLGSAKRTTSATLSVGQKLVLSSPGTRRWKVRTRTRVLSSAKTNKKKRSRTITFTATRPGKGTLRLAQQRGRKTVRRTIRVTVKR